MLALAAPAPSQGLALAFSRSSTIPCFHWRLLLGQVPGVYDNLTGKFAVHASPYADGRGEAPRCNQAPL